MSRRRICRHCHEPLPPGSGEAFCPKNKNAEKNRAAWRAGKKFQTGPAQKPFVVRCLIVPPSPFHAKLGASR